DCVALRPEPLGPIIGLRLATSGDEEKSEKKRPRPCFITPYEHRGPPARRFAVVRLVHSSLARHFIEAAIVVHRWARTTMPARPGVRRRVLPSPVHKPEAERSHRRHRGRYTAGRPRA